MAITRQDRKAMTAGVRQARETIRRRNDVLAQRVERLSAIEGLVPPVEVAPAANVALLGPPAPNGVIIAEGDSWFDYPRADVLSILEDRFGFDVQSVARAGDRVEDMAYSGGQLEKFTRQVEKAIRNGRVPQAVLLSGGGNDIAGREFSILLNPASGPAPGWNDEIVSGLINSRLRHAYLFIISAITRICEERAGRRIRIVLHGYDDPVPDGRGFLGGSWLLPGPWLEPGFRQKGYLRLAQRQELMAELIRRFNTMLTDLVELEGLEHVVHVNLRGTLQTGATYKRWWENELHPTRDGFLLIAERFARAVLQ
jgi:hypothetical protein